MIQRAVTREACVRETAADCLAAPLNVVTVQMFLCDIFTFIFAYVQNIGKMST